MQKYERATRHGKPSRSAFEIVAGRDSCAPMLRDEGGQPQLAKLLSIMPILYADWKYVGEKFVHFVQSRWYSVGITGYI